MGGCALFLGAAALHPAHGLELELCPSKVFVGAPCPGCGLTRSVSCAVRGRATESWAYHPFGLALTGLVVTTGAAGLLPRRGRAAVLEWTQVHRKPLRTAAVITAAAFMTFGLLRAIGLASAIPESAYRSPGP